MTETTQRSLRYDFTAVEIHDLSLELAKKTKEHSSLTEEKKSVVSQYAAKLNEVKATCNKLSNQVSDGWEFRDTKCRIEYNKPEHGKKTIIRLDTDKVVGIETMTDYDHNLFTQEGVEGDLLDAGKELREGLAENGMTIKGGSGKPGDPVVIEVDEKKRKRKK